MMFDDTRLVNIDDNKEEKERKFKKINVVSIKTNKSNLVKFAKIQFLGMLFLCIAIIIIAIIFANSKAKTQTVEVEKTVEVPVVDQQLVDEAVQQRVEEFVANYEPETITVEKVVEVEKPVEVAVEKIVTVVDQQQVQQLANEMAEEFKTQYVEEQEAARISNVSTIKVLVYLPNYSDSFYLEMNGSLHDELVRDDIKDALYNDERFLDTYKIKKIENRDAVEVFVGRNYFSTRIIHLQYK